MKKFAKILSLLLSLLFMFPSTTTLSYASSVEQINFSDVLPAAWYASDLKYITNDVRKILQGYPDGKYHPNDTLSVEQFIKAAVSTAGRQPSPENGSWSQPYIDLALEFGMIQPNQFDSYKRGITRGEMASIIVAGFTKMSGDNVLTYDVNEMKQRIPDYQAIPTKNIDAVCKAFAMGIIQGYPDKNFHSQDVLTRAQATVVIRRIIDSSARLKLQPLSTLSGTDMWTNEEFEAYMATDKWKERLNPNPINRMVDGRIEYSFFVSIDPVTSEITSKNGFLEEPLDSLFYNLTKHMLYYAIKFDSTATVSYLEEIGGKVEFDFAEKAPWKGYGSDVSFSLHFTKEPEIREDVYYYIPEAKNVGLKYEWDLRTFHKSEDVIGLFGTDKIKTFDYTIDKYVAVLKTICQDIYGEKQGSAFCDFMTENFDIRQKDFTNALLNYTGKMPSLGTDVMFHYPEPWNKLLFYTGEVEMKK